MSKVDCYKCKWSRPIPGDAHLRCVHPKLSTNYGTIHDVISMLGGAYLKSQAEKLNVKVNPHGLKNGWANFPYNFDPIWIESCDGYEPKGDKSELVKKEESE